MTRKDEVLQRLREAQGGWVNGSELATVEVGGSEGLKRLRELRADGYPIEERRHPDPRRTVWQYRLVGDGRMCSCGKGRVGHTTTHESTDTPGIVRIVREGKTDQYMNVRQAEAQAAQAEGQRRLEEAEKIAGDRFRVDPSSHRFTFGGRMPCGKCKGTGGTVRSMCLFCGGTGLR